METLKIMPIRVKVTSILKKAILSGEYRKGEELSLTDIANKLGVSRTPVREAIRKLEKDMKPLNIVLEEDTETLEDVVVTGIFDRKKKGLQGLPLP